MGVLAEDALSPTEQNWLERYRNTCPTRRRNFIHNGSLYTRIDRSKTKPRYASIAGMGGVRMWEWIKSEVVKIERRERRRLATAVRNSIGVGI